MRTSMLVAVLLGTALSISSTMAIAKKADPTAAANRETAHFVHDATDPYCATGGKECRHHRHHWGWGWGWHHHHDWGWWHEEHHHMRHHRHHKKAM